MYYSTINAKGNKLQLISGAKILSLEERRKSAFGVLYPVESVSWSDEQIYGHAAMRTICRTSLRCFILAIMITRELSF